MDSEDLNRKTAEDYANGIAQGELDYRTCNIKVTP